jgi:hypothetical protein
MIKKPCHHPSNAMPIYFFYLFCVKAIILVPNHWPLLLAVSQVSSLTENNRNYSDWNKQTKKTTWMTLSNDMVSQQGTAKNITERMYLWASPTNIAFIAVYWFVDGGSS